MRPTPIPDNEIWPGATRKVFTAPDGDPTNPNIAPVEALVDRSPSTGALNISVRCVLEDGELEHLAGGGTVWLTFWGAMVPWSASVAARVAAPAEEAREEAELGADLEGSLEERGEGLGVGDEVGHGGLLGGLGDQDAAHQSRRDPGTSPAPDPAVISHLAGPVVDYQTEQGTVVRQRCQWCGTVLIDQALWLTAAPVGQDPTYPTWEVGRFVDVIAPDGRGGMWSLNAWTEGPVPESACLRMPLEVTA